MEAIIFSARWNGRATSCLTARGGGLPRFNYEWRDGDTRFVICHARQGDQRPSLTDAGPGQERSAFRIGSADQGVVVVPERAHQLADILFRNAEVLPPESPDDSESLRFYREWFTTATVDPALTPELSALGVPDATPLCTKECAAEVAALLA